MMREALRFIHSGLLDSIFSDKHLENLPPAIFVRCCEVEDVSDDVPADNDVVDGFFVLRCRKENNVAVQSAVLSDGGNEAFADVTTPTVVGDLKFCLDWTKSVQIIKNDYCSPAKSSTPCCTAEDSIEGFFDC
jgi:hypothetical protein